jgi:hypothetical protein
MSINWVYKGKPFDSQDIPESAVGFVYRITNKTTGARYIGKKLFYRTIVRPPLKGQRRKRRTVVESDWKTYFSSSDVLKKQLAESSIDNFDKEILAICFSKGMLSYTEAKLQFDLGVLFDESYLNGIIQVRINKTHVLGSKPNL